MSSNLTAAKALHVTPQPVTPSNILNTEIVGKDNLIVKALAPDKRSEVLTTSKNLLPYIGSTKTSFPGEQYLVSVKLYYN